MNELLGLDEAGSLESVHSLQFETLDDRPAGQDEGTEYAGRPTDQHHHLVRARTVVDPT